MTKIKDFRSRIIEPPTTRERVGSTKIDDTHQHRN
jgi:hypothetical protein